jgi:hypothetical protein
MITPQIMADALRGRDYPGGRPRPAGFCFIHIEFFSVDVWIKLFHRGSNQYQALLPVSMFKLKQRLDSRVVTRIAAESVAGFGGVGDYPTFLQSKIGLLDD